MYYIDIDLVEINLMSDNKFDYLHSIDIGLLRYNSAKKQVEIMLVLRQNDPFIGQWALPGIVINGDTEDESIHDALQRLISSTKVGFKAKYYEQVGTTEENNKHRDPRCWSSSTFYMGIIDESVVLKKNQRFVKLETISSGQEYIAFDHNLITKQIHDRLISKSTYSSLPILLLNEHFTVLDAINVCGSIMNAEISKTGQRKRCEKLIEQGFVETTNQKTQASRGAPQGLLRTVITNKLYFFDRAISAQ